MANQTPADRAQNMAKAMSAEFSKTWVPSTTVKAPRGAIRSRRATLRGPAKKLVRKVAR